MTRSTGNDRTPSTATTRRTGLLVVVVALLIGSAAWLGRSPDAQDDAREGPAFPRAEALSEGAENGRRPTEAAPEPSDQADPALAAGLQLPGRLPKLPPSVDDSARLRRALAAPGHGYLMINVATLTSSDIAQKLVRCRGGKAMSAFDQIRDETGLDLQRDVDHMGIGLGDDVMAVSGRMARIHVPDAAQSYGKDARIWQMTAKPEPNAALEAGATAGTPNAAAGEAAASKRRQHIALVGDGTLLFADSEAQLKAAVDRLDGTGPAEPSSAGNGDVQGQLLAGDLARMLGQPQAGEQPMVTTLRKLATRARLRMNVGSDVAMSVDLDATGADQGEELAKAVRGGVALMRQAARHGDRKDLERLLDRAKVLDAEDGNVGFDLAVPGPWILDRFGCDADGYPKQP